MRSRYLVVPLLIPIVAGCGPGSAKITHTATSNDAALPAGWTRATSKDGGASIGVPPGWKPKDLSQSQFGDVAAKGKEVDPEDAAGGSLKSDNFKLWIFEKPRGGFASNLSVQGIVVPTGTTLEQVTDSAKQEMAQPDRKMTESDLQTAAGPAKELAFSMNLAKLNATLTIHSIVVIKGTHAYILTGTYKDADEGGMIDSMAKTFQAP